MKKKGEEVKVDQADQATFEEVQKIVEQQEAKLKEESDGPNLSPVSVSYFSCSSFFFFFYPFSDCLFSCIWKPKKNGVLTRHDSAFFIHTGPIRRRWRRR
jgi:hypothetical protein